MLQPIESRLTYLQFGRQVVEFPDELFPVGRVHVSHKQVRKEGESAGEVGVDPVHVVGVIAVAHGDVTSKVKADVGFEVVHRVLEGEGFGRHGAFIAGVGGVDILDALDTTAETLPKGHDRYTVRYGRTTVSHVSCLTSASDTLSNGSTMGEGHPFPASSRRGRADVTRELNGYRTSRVR